jgi:tetratricopeptide (TPR) repeat protein
LALDSPLPAQFQASVLYAAALGLAYDDSDDVPLNQVQYQDLTALRLATTDTDQDDTAFIALLGQAIGLDSINSSLYLARGALYLRGADFKNANGDYAVAVTQLQRTAPNDPALAEALVGLGQTQLMLGPASDAVTSFQAAVKAAADNFPANLGLGEAALADGNSDAAIAALTTALSLANTTAYKAEALFWRAQAYQAAKQTQAEIADLQGYQALASADNVLAPTVVARLTVIGPVPTSSPTVTTTPTRTRLGTPAAASTRIPVGSATRPPARSATPKGTVTATTTSTKTATPKR